MNRKYYDCFSIQQMIFLKSNKLTPERTAIHYKTKKTIWIFERNQELDRLLTEWTRNKHKQSAVV